jgi:hypothetical protein
MMAPVVMTPMVIVTDAPPAVMGPDHPAIGVSVIRRRIVEAVMEMVPEPNAAMVERKAVMAEAAAMEGCTAKTAASMETSPMTPTAMETAAMETAAMATTAVAAADFGYEPVGGVFRRGRGRRIDQRQRFGALAGYGGQRQ